ncbi:SUMF1/EgtB/PvdO family nonheme iron enzyme [Brumimicrobium mesophilum]|uniref:SUMF1/EgtB/PvdO family nonheme iron enzyme n=1 Tax=Brumimicrobium mesophilum TaxID=392717 RepID=UPI000D143D81|nr:SUMF1/EgtB/PvdO family nonheme iron enzyme [Brumimicrobium mesophilum]
MKYLFILIPLVLFSCGSYKSVSLDFDEELNPPPGTTKISENLFFDATEINNFHWLEYTSWLKKVYGEQSEEYKNALPNQKVWSTLNENYSDFDNSYFTHPSYRAHPIVGISYEQAIAYSKWRSDRVMEYILIQEGVIAINSSKNKDSIFTIEKYFKGQYLNHQPSQQVKIYPEYRLPSPENFRKLSVFADSINEINGKSCKGDNSSESIRLNCIEDKTKALPFGKQPTLATSIKCNKTVIHHLQGNVREMTDIQGNFYGLSFIDSCEEDSDKVVSDDNLINAYTGFRNVCVYKKWRE